jgi:hypothetical protein
MKFRSHVEPPEPMRGLEVPQEVLEALGGGKRPAPRLQAITPDILKRSRSPWRDVADLLAGGGRVSPGGGYGGKGLSGSG